MNYLKEWLSKLNSGKFLLTMMVGGAFTYLAVKGTLPQDKVMEVVLIVIYAYFTKHDTPKGA